MREPDTLLKTTTDVVTTCAALATAGIAYFQLRNLNASSQATNLLRLRELLMTFDDVDAKLRPDGEWQTADANIQDRIEAQKFDRYAGALEAGLHMVARGQLQKSAFEEQFGYRLANLASSHAAITRLRAEASSWRTMLAHLDEYYAG